MAKKYKNPGPIAFRATIQRHESASGSAAYVSFPYDLKETFGVGNLVPCVVTFDTHVTYRGSLAKMCGPSAIIVVRKKEQAALGKGIGESVNVVVALDESPRTVEVASDIQKELQAAGQWERFCALSLSRRREYLQWIEEAKRPETRSNRLQKICQEVAAG
jgi:hypothetical protein